MSRSNKLWYEVQKTLGRNSPRTWHARRHDLQGAWVGYQTRARELRGAGRKSQHQFEKSRLSSQAWYLDMIKTQGPAPVKGRLVDGQAVRLSAVRRCRRPDQQPKVLCSLQHTWQEIIHGGNYRIQQLSPRAATLHRFVA